MDDDHSPETQGINTFSEKSLHIALKQWYARPGDRFEVEVDGSVIDLLRDDLLIEIQTRNFSAMKTKLKRLLKAHHVRLVHPIPLQRWIVKMDAQGREVSRRRSPRRGHPAQLFAELVYIWPLALHASFSLEILLVHDEEVRCDDGQGSWRRKGWSICDRRLLDVHESHVFSLAEDYLTLLPEDLAPAFTTADLATSLKQRRRVAQQMCYCLRKMGVLDVVEKRGNSQVYRRVI